LEESVLDSDHRRHCVTTIAAIVAQKSGDRRAVLQLGYNLGRLSELTGLGREPFWDRWKTAVEAWNLIQLEELVQDLQRVVGGIPAPSSGPSEPSASSAARKRNPK
jgi:hypothetical protein